MTSIQKFYADMETLHELVKPYQYQVSISRLQKSFDALREELGAALLPVVNMFSGDL